MLPILASAAPRDLIQSWETEEGLPQNIVNAVVQTHDGYLWCGTPNGLARFDGIRFEIFNAESTPELGSARIRQLFVDRRGILWISTSEGGLIRMHEGKFTAFHPPSRTSTQRCLTSMADDSSGTLWLGAEDGAIIQFRDGIFQTASSQWDPLGSKKFAATSDANGRLWITSRLELSQLENGQLKSVLDGPFGQYQFVAPNRTNGWWINMGGKIRLWRENQWLAERGAPAWGDRGIACALEDRRGTVWVGSNNSGLFRYDADGTVQQYNAQTGLGSDLVRSLCEDHEGNLWVGTSGGGLRRLRPPLFKVFGREQGLSSNLITSISEGAPGELWVGTENNGLNRILNGRIQPLPKTEGLDKLQVRSLLQNRAGTLWIGTTADGLFKLENNRLRPVPPFSDPGTNIGCLFEDAQSKLWVGQQSADSLRAWNNGLIETLPLPKAFPAVDIVCLSEDASGTLWIGTDGDGLFAIHSGQWKHYGQAEGLPSEFIRALQIDTDGCLWIGTHGGGLTRFKNGEFRSCSTSDGLLDNVVNFIAEDAQGFFWLSSFQGIFRVQKSDLHRFADGAQTQVTCVGFGKGDGLPAMECPGGFQPAGCKTRDGQLWFPTINGVAVIDPAKLTPNPVLPPVYLEKITVDGLAQSSGDLNPQKYAFLSVGPGQHRFEFRYTGLNFSAPERVRFRYRLEGLDKQWVEAGNRRSANYSYVPPGRYRFQVIACNQDGVWNSSGATLSMEIEPQLRERRWFKLSVFALTALALAAAVRAATRRRFKLRLQHLETQRKIEAERTRIAQDIHDDLGAGLTQISWLGVAAERRADQADEVRGHARKISGTASDMVRSLDEIVWAVRPVNDSLNSLVEYLGRRVDELFEDRAIRAWFSAPSQLPELVVLADVRHNFYLACKEALNNVLKHSAATEVRIDLRFNEPELGITIQDNGRGFVPDGPSGNGLRNMRERIEKLGGQFKLQSQAGTGTLIDFSIRLTPPPSS